jgi:hypothetical protein
MNKEAKSTNKQVPAKKNRKEQSGKKAPTTLSKVWRYVWMCRGVIISLPVLVVAICQAFRNASRLPETVGLNIQATGVYAMTVARPTAVVLPLLITLACIVMTCLTKRNLFPWLISVFSLVLPVLIWFINIYPA